MTAGLIFSTQDHETTPQLYHELENLQILLQDKLDERNYDTLLITTTRSMDSGKRTWWTVDVEADYTTMETFFEELTWGSIQEGSLDIYEDDDGFLYGIHKEGGRMSIWKFHFLHDLEMTIDHVITHVGSQIYEDFVDTLEYALQDADYIDFTEDLTCSIVEDGLEAKVFIGLPYMQEILIHGTLVYDTDIQTWLIDLETLDYIEAFDTYVNECLY